MRDLLLITIVVLCSVIALRRPVVGMLAFVCYGFLNPHSMVWGFGRTFPFAQLIAIATVLGYLLWSEEKRLPRQRELFLLLGLWAAFGSSTWFAFYPEDAWAFLTHISKILLMVFLSMFLINTEQRLRWLLRVIALALGFFAVKGGIFAIMSGGDFIVFGPDRSFLAARNAIGLALTMNVPILFYLLKMEHHAGLRWIMKGMLVFSYPAIICTYSRGAWLGLAAVTAVIIFKSKYKVYMLPVAYIFAVAAMPTLLHYTPQRLSDRYDELVNYDNEASAQSRLWTWEFCKRVGLAHPLTGGGFSFNSVETYTKYFPEFLEEWPGKEWTCHSIWFTMFAQHGFPGLIPWMALIGSCLLSLKQIRAYGRAHAEMFWVTHVADMLQTALVAFMVVGTFLDAAYFDMFYYLIAVLIITKEMIGRSAVVKIRDVPLRHSKRALVGEGRTPQPTSV